MSWRELFRRQPRDLSTSDRVVELAWMPLWQAQLVLHHLWEAGVPTTLSEDHTAMLRFGAREPMAHLYVMERRLVEARGALAEVTGPAAD